MGTLLVAALAGLCWLDHIAEVGDPARAGIWLFPVAILLTVLASGEVLHLAEAGGMHPLPWAVYCGNLLLVASAWIPRACSCGAEGAPSVAPEVWPPAALSVGVLLVFVGEMLRFEKPGGVTANIAVALLALVYVGLMLGLVVQLRMAWGIAALASLVIVVKMGDTGAYMVGRLIGRHKLAPVLSPGKTIEGAIGALAFACLGAWATFQLLLPLLGAKPGHWWGWILFGLLVAAAGLLGDLAESFLKRDVARKDSSSWMPGFGGVLDILDSILLAAPVAWLCWALGLVRA